MLELEVELSVLDEANEELSARELEVPVRDG